MLKIKLNISTNVAGQFLLVDHRVCNKDGERDADVSQGNNLQKLDESLQRFRFLAS